MRARRLVAAPATALLAALALALAGTYARGWWAGFAWGPAHAAIALYGFLLPAWLAFLRHGWSRFLPGAPDDAKLQRSLAAMAAGSLAIAAAAFLAPKADLAWLAFAGGVLLAAAGGMLVPVLLRALPARGVSVVRSDEPLTKGDDACAKQLRFSTFFLPLGLVLVAASLWPGLGAWSPRLHAAGLHVLLGGHVLLAVYALCHLWVPRFSGVPAIAAGAIKGELHSTLGGVTFLLAGFLTRGVWSGSKGLLVAGGGFLFLGVFTFMGVLGANIMKNKSRTQRVTPEFSYIPWTFAGVFWLLSGILLGLFLNARPDALADKAAALRFTHIHAALFGGAAQLLAALLVRAVPMAQGRGPPPFARGKWAFLLWNAGLAVALVGALGPGLASTSFGVGALLAAAGAVAALKTLLPSRAP